MRSVRTALGLFVDAVVDVDRLRGALQPPRRGERRRGCCSSPAASPRAWRRSRSTGARRAQRGVRAQPGRDAPGAGRRARRDRRGARRCGAGSRSRYAASAVLFAVSIWVPSRCATCSGRSRSASSRARCWPRTQGGSAGLGGNATGARCARRTRVEALDPHHFAERFGLFLIILLGEVVVEAGQGSAEATSTASAAGRRWSRRWCSRARCGGCTSTPQRRSTCEVLELSGGSPTMARAIFAVGHISRRSRC